MGGVLINMAWLKRELILQGRIQKWEVGYKKKKKS
jgi:hypothetical protein